MAENLSNDDLSIQNLLVAYGAHMKRPRVEGSDASSTQIGKGIEKPIQLLGLIFEIRLRCPASPDVGQDFPSTGGHAERHVSSFLLFLQAGKGSILPTMLMASKEWHTQKQQAGITCLLQQVLFLKVVEELVQWIGKFNPDDQ